MEQFATLVDVEAAHLAAYPAGVSEFLCVRRCETFPRRRVNGACDVPADAVEKSVFILRDYLGESILVEDRELVHGGLPVVPRAAPVFGDVAQCQPNQLGGRVVAGEVPARLDGRHRAGLVGAGLNLSSFNRSERACSC